MKLFRYIGLSFVLTLIAVLLLTRGPAPESHPAVMFALIVLFGIPPLGAFWMMYMSIRYEKRPMPLLALAAFIPFTFVWYYFERIRTGKVARTRDSA
jgi:heme/copper-type cytochrome/quinol oxidase subunit 4